MYEPLCTLPESLAYPLVKPVPPPINLFVAMLLSPPTKPSLHDLVDAAASLPHNVADTDFNSLSQNIGLLTDNVSNATFGLLQQRVHSHYGSPPTTIILSSYLFAQTFGPLRPLVVV